MSEWETVEGEHWAEYAEHYTRMLAPYGEAVLAAAAPQPGERVIDVGCGNGDLSLLAAAAVGPDGVVQGVDLSPAEVAVASRRSAEAGLSAARFAVADAARVEVDAPFDVLVSRFGVMFFDDPTGAFSHLRSLLRPGGRIAFACWQELFANEWMIVPGGAVASVLGLPGGNSGGPGPFSLADADLTRQMLTAAGFVDVDVEPVAAALWMGADADAAVEFMTRTGMGRILFGDAAPEQRAEAIERARDALRPHETDSGVMLDGAAWVVTATNPPTP